MKHFPTFGVKGPMLPATCLRTPVSFTLGLLLVLAAGCSSDDHGPGQTSGHRRPRGKPPTPMAGQDTFFDGMIVADLKVGPNSDLADLPDEGSTEKGGSAASARGGSGSFGGGGGGMGGGGMRGGGGGGMGGGRHHQQSADAGADSSTDSDRVNMHPMMMGSMGPPVLIHLRFTNQGSGRVELHIVDFSSPLGNFAVQPEVLVLDPGQSLETEPMSSQLAGSLTEADATLVLRLAGKSEKKIVALHAVPAAPKEAGAAPTPGDGPAPARDAPPGSGK